MKEENEKYNINREYITMLYMQFLKACGIKDNYGINHQKEFEKEFVDWTVYMTRIQKDYVDLLLYMNSDPGLIGELGKGKLDSVVPELLSREADAIAITPYADTFDDSIKTYNGVITFGLKHEPLIRYYGDMSVKIGAPNIPSVYNPNNINTLITQLPIGDKSLEPLIMSSCRYNDIMIGTYGFTSDEDIKEKLVRLRKIKESIENLYCVSCEVELTKINGTYQYILKSNQKTLQLRSLHR